MEHLFLEDLQGHTQPQVQDYLVDFWKADRDEVKKYHVLIGYVAVGCWGCDSSAFFLLREKETGDLYEVHGAHCSCYGFEDQFKPEKTDKEYLASNKFNFWTGGYDDNAQSNKNQVKEFITKIAS